MRNLAEEFLFRIPKTHWEPLWKNTFFYTMHSYAPFFLKMKLTTFIKFYIDQLQVGVWPRMGGVYLFWIKHLDFEKLTPAHFGGNAGGQRTIWNGIETWITSASMNWENTYIWWKTSFKEKFVDLINLILSHPVKCDNSTKLPTLPKRLTCGFRCINFGPRWVQQKQLVRTRRGSCEWHGYF